MRANIGAIAIAIVVVGTSGRSVSAQQMSHDTSMAKDGMAKDGMAKDGMAKDGMKHDAMGHDAMGHGAKFTKGEVAVTGGYEITGAMGHQVLTLSPDFTLGKAPAPYVVLSTTTDLGQSPVWLGALEKGKGSQTFEIPAGVDLAHYAHVVIWCKPQKVTLASADLPHGAMSGM